MSKQNSLPDFLTDLADGIRTAEGSTAPINPQDFRSRVEALPTSGGSGGGESGVPIEVTELPEATADTVGKVCLTTTSGEHYVCKRVDFANEAPFGTNKIYLDTTKNPLDYVDYMSDPLFIVSNLTTKQYALSMVDILAEQGMSAYGHCYVLGFASPDMSEILGVAYVYCDMMDVATFNAMIGSQFGLSITEFGWQTDVIDAGAVDDSMWVYMNNLANWDYLAYSIRWQKINKIDTLIDGSAEEVVSYASAIKPYLFYTDHKLKKAKFLNTTIEEIGANAFSDCLELKELTICSITPPVLRTGALDTGGNLTVYVPAESVEAYKAANDWKGYADKIQAIPE